MKHNTRTPSHCCCWGGGHSIQRTRRTHAYTIHCAYTVHRAYITIWLTSTERVHRVLHRIAATPCIVHTSHISATPCQWLVHRSTYTMLTYTVRDTCTVHHIPYIHQELDDLGRVGASSAATCCSYTVHFANAIISAKPFQRLVCGMRYTPYTAHTPCIAKITHAG